MASQRSQPAVPINSRKKKRPQQCSLKKKLHTLSTQVLVGAIFRIVGGVERVEVEGECTLITKRRKQGENKARACESKPFADRWFSTSQPAHGRPILHPKWPDRGRGTFQYVVCRCVADARNFQAFEAWRAFCFGCSGSHHRTPSPLPHTHSQFWTRCSIPVNLRVHCT